MAGGKWRGLRRTLLRRQVYEPDQVEQTGLKRCLNRWDLTAIGVGSTLGLGVYVVIGHVALNLAGPSVVLSFLIAAVAALFAGLCYAEFGARIPKAGGAYSYTYLAIGELVAFIVGWNNILEAVFGAASIARGLSLHMDTMFNMTMSEWFTVVAPISINFISPYFDIFAALMVLIIGALLSFGVREAVTVNNLFSAVNIFFVLFIVVVGAFAANPGYWNIPLEEVPPGQGVGGFFPFGVWGTLRGAAVCFFGFVGFDTICAAGEEVREPRRAIPFTILSVLGITFLCYTSVSTVVSMMMPYYLQDSVIAVSGAFAYVQWEWARWVVGAGTLFGLHASLFGAMYPLTRLMYSMSCDGLLAGCLSKLTTTRQSPAAVTIGCTVVIATLAGVMEVESLILMTCIGTLISYTAVATSVIIMRYGSDYTPGQPLYVRQLFGIGRSPTHASSRIVNVSLLLFMCLALSSALVVMHVPAPLTPCVVLNVLALVFLLVIAIQPSVKEEIYFKTPLVPLVPCLSIYINFHLMVLINIQNWIVVGAWTLIGILIYFITICCCKRPQKSKLEDNVAISVLYSHTRNGKPHVQIVVESPTPPDTLNRISDYGCGEGTEDIVQNEIQTIVRNDFPIKTEEIILHQAYIENNEEKEAKIIDLLDQVLQAEEDSYGEVTSIKEQKDEEICATENVVQRKSLSELSDAGSDASLGNQGLSKYDVIAQVHREDLPRVTEEEEKSEREDTLDENEIDDHEQITAFNNSETNSRTDESGYSDTIDRNALIESLEESKEEITNIPIPPPFPSDENFFRSPNFRKAYTIVPKHRNSAPSEMEDEVNKPRESVKSNQSNGSMSEDNLAFGSDRQIHFMSKLNNIFQNKMNGDEEEPRQRSRSTGNVVENTDFSLNRERPPMFLALKDEILSKEVAQNLRPVNAEETKVPTKVEEQTKPVQEPQPDEEEETPEEIILSKEDLKSKLENIFAAGGPMLLKPRLMKSNPPTPEESYQTDTSSTESIPKLPKMDKNDTLKRQKDKFSAVLNSIRLSYSKDDAV